MAETDEYPSTPLWLLLCDARALVTRYTKSESQAEDLIHEYAGRKHRIAYGWRHSSPLSDSPSDRGGFPPWRYNSDEADKTGVHSIVDWENSTIRYIRTMPDPHGPGLEILKALKDFLPAEPFIEYTLVRLRHRDLIYMLIEVGLMQAPTPSLPPAIDAAATSDPPPPTGGTELWVYNTMKANRPQTSDLRGEYVDKLEGWCKVEGIKRKTLANYFYKYRKQFERP